jgi:putative hydrolase of the HAD superfamily
MTTPVRAVFFDLGGTLFSNREIPKINIGLLRRAARRLGVDDDIARVGPAYVKASVTANEVFKDRPFYLHRDLFHATYDDFVRRLGGEMPPGYADWLYQAQLEVMTTRLVLREDCIDTLKILRERGLMLAIVSNIDDDYFGPMLENLGLTEYFDQWSSSEEAMACKPNPAFFEYALKKAGCTADEVIFVGDSRLHDVRGARQVGMRAVLIEERWGRSPLDVGDDDPHHVIGTLSEIPGLVDSMLEVGGG